LSSQPEIDSKDEFLTRDEFFVVLAQLQKRLGENDTVFFWRFIRSKAPKAPRRNPFKAAKESVVVATSPVSEQQDPKSPSTISTNKEVVFDQFSDLEVISQQQPGKTVSHKWDISTEKEVSIDNSSAPEIVSQTTGIPGSTSIADNLFEASGETNTATQRHPLSTPPQILGNGVHSQPGDGTLGRDIQQQPNPNSSGANPSEVAPLSTRESSMLAKSRLPPLDPKKKLLSKLPIKQQSKAHTGYYFKDLGSALKTAASEGNLPLVVSILEFGADVNYLSHVHTNEYAHKALSKAAKSGHGHIVSYLLGFGANAFSATCALREALKNESLQTATVLQLLDHADIYAKFHKKSDTPITSTDIKFEYDTPITSMLLTKRQDRTELLSKLFNHPKFELEKHIATMAPVDCKDYFLTCLTVITQLNDLEIAKLFFQRAGDKYQIPPQFIKLLAFIDSSSWKKSPAATLEFANLLLSHGAQPGLNQYGTRHTASHTSPLREAIKEGLYLGDSSTRIAAKYSIGHASPLMGAIQGGCLDGVKLFLDSGADADCNMIDIYDRSVMLTPLHVAAAWGHVDICRILVEKGAISCRHDAQGNTPLWWACKEGKPQVVEYLLSLKEPIIQLYQALCVAVGKNNSDIVELLLNQSEYPLPQLNEPLFVAVGRNQARIVELLLNYHPHPDDPHPLLQLNKALCAAISMSNARIVALLVNHLVVHHQAHPLRIQWKSRGTTAFDKEFTLSKRAEHAEIVDMLLLAGYKVSVDDVKAMIDQDNLATLIKVLEAGDKVLDFNKNTEVIDWDWRKSFGQKGQKKITCVVYAEKQGAQDFVELFQEYKWTRKAIQCNVSDK
jgi:ankyrin repeat protein